MAFETLGNGVYYVVLLFALFIIPRLLQPFRIPTAITSFALGAVSGIGLNRFQHDPTIELLSTFGIVALFLFAGMEVEFAELRRERRILFQHVLIRVAALSLAAPLFLTVLDVDLRTGLLIALAILTPSTGFILDSLGGLGLSSSEQFWIRSKAIATEIVALVVLFGVIQSESLPRLAVSTGVLVGMIVLLPLAFRFFARIVVPFAPNSEFAFLIIMAVVCAMITRELGVYYLVGAFAVGIAAQHLRESLPSMSSEKMLHAVEAFGSIFVPFYFFHAGLLLRMSDLGIAQVIAGASMLLVFLALRLGLLAIHRGVAIREKLHETMRVGVPMLPTLVFTLVIVEILRERGEVPSYMLGGLIVYSIVNTLIPGLVMKSPPPEFEVLHPPPLTVKSEPESSGDHRTKSPLL